MAIVAAWWGVWQLISGFSLAYYWSRRDAGEPETEIVSAEVAP
jgi:hypothetical protein